MSFTTVDPVDREGQSKIYNDWTFVDTWKEMEKIPKEKARAIGVSNFGIENLKTLLKDAKTVPAVNQCEAHINCPSTALVEFCKEKGIHFTAYSCLGSTNSPLANDQTLKDIAEKHNTSSQKVLLVWNLQRGEGKYISVIPKSVTPSRIAENLKLDGLKLSDEEMDKLNSTKDRFKVCNEWLPVKVFSNKELGQDFYDKDPIGF
jgi:glycerol 2-dehydrogenase (NADP+)